MSASDATAVAAPPVAPTAAETAADALRRRSRRNRRVGIALRYVLLTVLAAIVIFPIYITVVNSLLPVDKLTSKPPTFFPTDPQWDTYGEAWDRANMGRYLLNSFIMTTLVTVGQVVTAILAGYAFAFLEFPLKRTLFVLFLSTLMVPFEVVFFSNLTTVSDLGFYDTYLGLALPFLATGFGAFLLRQSFLTVPRDLKDAAALDGYGHWRFMWRVAVPLSRPAVGALGVFAFLAAWNQYLWPLIVANEDHWTVQIGLRQLSRTSLSDINITIAATVLAFLPLVVILIAFSKQLVRGLTAGAVKG